MTAKQSPCPTDLSDAARVREVAEICAVALIRHFTQKSSEVIATVANKAVDAGAEQSVCCGVVNPNVEAA